MICTDYYKCKLYEKVKTRTTPSTVFNKVDKNEIVDKNAIVDSSLIN